MNHINKKEVFGMTQEYMAMLLQVSRSQWSMYVLGKRDLPVGAKLKLAQMLGFSEQNKNKDHQNFEDKKEQEGKIVKRLASQQLLNAKLQNSYKQKWKATEKKYTTSLTALQFITFLEANVQKPTEAYQLLLQTIKRDAETAIEKNGMAVQAELQLKWEILQGERKILSKKMQSMK
jgi:transcriptional regulator with XRE-family HTH domain